MKKRVFTQKVAGTLLLALLLSASVAGAQSTVPAEAEPLAAVADSLSSSLDPNAASEEKETEATLEKAAEAAATEADTSLSDRRRPPSGKPTTQPTVKPTARPERPYSVQGNGFSVTVPGSGYRVSTKNGRVTVSALAGSASITIERKQGTTPEQAINSTKQALKNKGYNQTATNLNARGSNGAYQLVATGSNLRAYVYAFPAGNDTILTIEEYDLASLDANEPTLAAIRKSLSYSTSNPATPKPTTRPTSTPKPTSKPSPTVKPTATPTPSNHPNNWPKQKEISYWVGSVKHTTTATKATSPKGYAFYKLSGYNFTTGTTDVLSRKNNSAFVTVDILSAAPRSALNSIAATLKKQGYLQLKRSDMYTPYVGESLEMALGDTRVIFIAYAGIDGTYVLKASYDVTDASALPEINAQLSTFTLYAAK